MSKKPDYYKELQNHPAWIKRCEIWDKQEEAKKILNEEIPKMIADMENTCDHKFTFWGNDGHSGFYCCKICGKDHVEKGIDIDAER